MNVAFHSAGEISVTKVNVRIKPLDHQLIAFVQHATEWLAGAQLQAFHLEMHSPNFTVNFTVQD